MVPAHRKKKLQFTDSGLRSVFRWIMKNTTLTMVQVGDLTDEQLFDLLPDLAEDENKAKMRKARHG